MPLPAVLLALLLGALSALAVACGNSSELLSERRAARLTGDVDRVAEAVRQGDCEATSVRLQELQAEVAELPSSVSPDLRRNLEDGVTRLASQAVEECQGEQVETPTTETEPPPVVETTETTETTEPPAETPTEPAETEPPADTEPPAETTPPAGTEPADPADPAPAPDAGEDDDATGGTQGDAGTGGVGAGGETS
jgi:outer membrane biosynthesis protein TonB